MSREPRVGGFVCHVTMSRSHANDRSLVSRSPLRSHGISSKRETARSLEIDQRSSL